MCGDCEKLTTFITDNHAILKECEKCCTVEAEKDGSVLYSSAILSVCSWKIGRYPSVKSFIENSSKKYSNLEVKYLRGADPVLTMVGGSDGSPDLEMGIGNYEEHDIVAYLDQHLKKVQKDEEEETTEDEEEEEEM